MVLLCVISSYMHTLVHVSFFLFFFNDTATTEIYTLSLHDALPISRHGAPASRRPRPMCPAGRRRMTALSNRSPRGRLYRALGGRAAVPVGFALEGVPGREQRGLRERAADELQADGQAERIETAGND